MGVGRGIMENHTEKTMENHMGTTESGLSLELRAVKFRGQSVEHRACVEGRGGKLWNTRHYQKNEGLLYEIIHRLMRVSGDKHLECLLS